MMHKPVIVITLRKRLLVAALTVIVSTAAAFAQNYERSIRYGNSSSFAFDGRDDNRDFPTNGFFPGNFAADPSYAAIGAAGFLGSNPQRSAWPYPSQLYFGIGGGGANVKSR
jgi:hypothetical protein